MTDLPNGWRNWPVSKKDQWIEEAAARLPPGYAKKVTRQEVLKAARACSQMPTTYEEDVIGILLAFGLLDDEEPLAKPAETSQGLARPALSVSPDGTITGTLPCGHSLHSLERDEDRASMTWTYHCEACRIAAQQAKPEPEEDGWEQTHLILLTEGLRDERRQVILEKLRRHLAPRVSEERFDCAWGAALRAREMAQPTPYQIMAARDAARRLGFIKQEETP